VRFVAVRLVALLVAVIGAVNLVTAVRPYAMLATTFDGGAPGRAQSLVIGLVLLAIARGLVTGRRVAWVAALIILTVATATTMPHRPVAMLLTGTALAALVTLRAEFGTAPDPGRLRLAGQVSLVAATGALIGGGWVAVTHRDSGRTVVADLSTGSPGSWSAMLLMFTIAATLVLAVLIALAPAGPPAPGDVADRGRVRDLARDPDADSLAPFATRADKSYVFDPSGRAAIGYRVLFGTALAGGDPVGRSTAAPHAMRAFLDLCTARGWRPGVLGASDAMAAHWRDLGLHGFRVGDEAVLPVDTFSLASRRMRNVRQAVNRTVNAGVTVTIDALTPSHAARLRPLLRDWLAGRRERGFAMNLDAILTPRPDCLIATAYAADGAPVAFARFGVCADGMVYTLDVAPRGRHSPNGVAERMIVEMVTYARAHGGREISLNFAAMRWAFESPGAVARLVATSLRLLDRWIEIAPLNRFCGKFAPSWRPRSLMSRSWLEIGWVAIAAMRAEFSTAVPAAAGAPGATPTPDLGFAATDFGTNESKIQDGA
jgi:lysylphosphatidylglycerol synthetase-like protein (DUF2156 family)